MIIKPLPFTTVDSELGTSIAKALWIQARDAMNYINASFPLGMVMMFDQSRHGIPSLPDSRFWKFLDGTPVVNTNSIFNGVTFPDMRGKFFRHLATGEIVGDLSGSDTANLVHDHTAVTAPAYSGGEDGVRRGSGGSVGEEANPSYHAHSIPSSPLVSPTVPHSYELQFYVRIV